MAHALCYTSSSGLFSNFYLNRICILMLVFGHEDVFLGLSFDSVFITLLHMISIFKGLRMCHRNLFVFLASIFGET
jgi:hypothetical protein